MMEIIRLAFAGILFLAGSVTILSAVLGVFRFRFVMNRMHSAAMVDSLGFLLVLAGLMVLSGSMEYIPKLLLVLVFQWVGSPIASHMVGRLEVQTDDAAVEHMSVKEAEGKE